MMIVGAHGTSTTLHGRILRCTRAPSCRSELVPVAKCLPSRGTGLTNNGATTAHHTLHESTTSLPRFLRPAARNGTRLPSATPSIVSFTCGAAGPVAASCLQLLVLYAVTFTLQRDGHISISTSQTLAQLLLHLIIPAWLFVTTASSIHHAFLQGIELQALRLVLAGSAVIMTGNTLAAVAAAALDGKLLWLNHMMASLPWQPTSAAAVIASTTASAIGTPAAAPALMPPQEVAAADTGLLKLACSSYDPGPYLLAALLLQRSLWEATLFTTLCQVLTSTCMLWLWGFVQRHTSRGQQVPLIWANMAAQLAQALSGMRSSSSTRRSRDSSSTGSSSSSIESFSPESDRPSNDAPTIRVDEVLVVDVDGSGSSRSRSSSGIYGQERTPGEVLQDVLDAGHRVLVAPLQRAWHALSSRLSPPALGLLLGTVAGLLLCVQPGWLSETHGAPWDLGVVLGSTEAVWQLAASLAAAALVLQQLLLACGLVAASTLGSSGLDYVQGRSELDDSDDDAVLPGGTIELDEEDDGLMGLKAAVEQRQAQQQRVRLRSIWSPDALAAVLLPSGTDRQCLAAAVAVRCVALPAGVLALGVLVAAAGVQGLAESMVLKAAMLLPVMPPALSMVLLQMQPRGADVFTAARAARFVLQMHLAALVAVPVWLCVMGRVLPGLA